MNALGIYFGPKTINITETKGKKLINNIQIPLFEVLGSGLEEKVPFEVKAVALLNDAFRMNKIEVKEANLCLSGKDLIIRTFEMPLMPKEELQSAISFEAKKYIPFKLEDLITDYQIEIDNLSHTNIVLFVGIKEETFNLYVSIFKQLNIKVNQIEYSGFSILRALKLGQANESGVTGLLCFDLESEDEINFMVLENGFPLFTRDINLTAGTEGLEKPEKLDSGAALEKLKSEVRVSMDYFHRKFPGKAIQKITVISGDEQRSSLETFMSELAISCKFLNISQVLGKQVSYSAGLVKGYCASIFKVIPKKLKLNLVERKASPVKASSFQTETLSLFKDINLDYRLIMLGVGICVAVFGFGLSQVIPLKQKINNVIAQRISVANVDAEASYEKLTGVNLEYKRKLEELDNLIKKQLYLTQTLDTIPRSIPAGVWLTDFFLNKGQNNATELSLQGMSYLADSDKEFEAVNSFLSNLRANPDFSKYFTEINISSIDHRQVDEKVTATSFVITARNNQEKR